MNADGRLAGYRTLHFATHGALAGETKYRRLDRAGLAADAAAKGDRKTTTGTSPPPKSRS